EHAAAASVRLHTGARIEGLRFLDDSAPAGWQLDLADGRQVSADQVLLACAPNVARRLLERSPHPITRAARARLSAPRAASYAACLQVALDPSTSGRFDFILGLDRPDYLSVFSLVADVAPHGSEVIHVMRYLDQSEATADTRAELEALLDAARPNWRRRVCEASYQPRLCVTHWVETVRHPRPDCVLAPGLFAAGDWIAGHGVLADAAVGSALEVSQRILGQRAEAAPRNAHLFATAGAVGELWS
ncbi:MAG: FAD-dependent oxidoreductase, partial [Myxococcales bacterium]|nr:FAD-dependent oxidoreductase [Myxococcales bacterium]